MGAPESNEQKRVHREKGARLDEHGDNVLAQSTHSTYSHAPGVEDEPDNDHEGEEDVE